MIKQYNYSYNYKIKNTKLLYFNCW